MCPRSALPMLTRNASVASSAGVYTESSHRGDCTNLGTGVEAKNCNPVVKQRWASLTNAKWLTLALNRQGNINPLSPQPRFPNAQSTSNSFRQLKMYVLSRRCCSYAVRTSDLHRSCFPNTSNNLQLFASTPLSKRSTNFHSTTNSFQQLKQYVLSCRFCFHAVRTSDLYRSSFPNTSNNFQSFAAIQWRPNTS